MKTGFADALMSENRNVNLETHSKRMKWVFSDITEKGFHWQDFVLDKDDEWIVMCDCIATRRQC